MQCPLSLNHPLLQFAVGLRARLELMKVLNIFFRLVWWLFGLLIKLSPLGFQSRIILQFTGSEVPLIFTGLLLLVSIQHTLVGLLDNLPLPPLLLVLPNHILVI